MEMDFSDVKPTLYTAFMITLLAVLGITFAKMLLSRYHVNGLSELVLAA